MALRRFSLPIIFALMLLFAHVLARDLEEKPAADHNDTTVENSDAEVDGYRHWPGQYRPGPYGPYRPWPYGPYPPRCRFYCGRRCCSEAEFAASSQGAEDQVDQADEKFGDEKWYGHGYGHGPHYGYGRRHRYGYWPPYCRYYCDRRCCSAEEYAEFVKDQN